MTSQIKLKLANRFFKISDHNSKSLTTLGFMSDYPSVDRHGHTRTNRCTKVILFRKNVVFLDRLKIVANQACLLCLVIGHQIRPVV